MRIEKENKWNTKTSMVNTENSPKVFKHFETMSFMPTQKAAYCYIQRSRGINIKMSSWEQIPLNQL